MTPQDIARLIDESPMNRGLSGADWVADPDNVHVVIGEDVMIFSHGVTEGDLTEFHWLRMVSKGRTAIDRTKQAFDTVFATSDTPAIFGVVSDLRPDAKLMARWIGAKSIGHVVTVDGPCEIFILTREMRNVVLEA